VYVCNAISGTCANSGCRGSRSRRMARLSWLRIQHKRLNLKWSRISGGKPSVKMQTRPRRPRHPCGRFLCLISKARYEGDETKAVAQGAPLALICPPPRTSSWYYWIPKAFENGIELPLFKRVNLHNYIRREENRPLPSLAAKWIGNIADILCHFHERRVFFGRHRPQKHPHLWRRQSCYDRLRRSTAFPLDTDMDEAIDGDVTVRTEIFNFSYRTWRWVFSLGKKASMICTLHRLEVIAMVIRLRSNDRD